MTPRELRKLHAAVEYLTRQPFFTSKVERLAVELANAREPFVWSTVALDSIPCNLPRSIKSCWIFHLRKGVWSGSHYHPNSTQHMIAVNGCGTSKVGGKRKRIVPFTSQERSLEEKWHVIRRNEPHEFMPESHDMTVVSFHTCLESELIEVACGSGVARVYEAPDAQQRAPANAPALRAGVSPGPSGPRRG